MPGGRSWMLVSTSRLLNARQHPALYHNGVEISDMMMCKMDHYSLKAPLEQTLYTVLNCVAGRATGRKGGWEYQPFQHSPIAGLR